jgi:iron(III) transport system permease protein
METNIQDSVHQASSVPAVLPQPSHPLSELAIFGSGGTVYHRILPQVLWLILALLVGAAVVLPLVRLESLAFADHGAAFVRMIQQPRFWETLRTTIILAVCSSLLAVLLGTGLAWGSSMLPRAVRRVGQLIPLLPLLVPTVSAVLGWMFMLSPSVGYLNSLLRKLPMFSSLSDGPFDIYTVPWIVLITALLLASFVYLFVHTGLENLGEEMEAAAAASGAGPMRRMFTITIPLLRPSILFAAAIVFLLGMGQFTVPLLLGRTSNIDVLTTQMFFLAQNYPIDYGLGAALGFPILMVGLVLVIAQKYLLGDQRRFVVVSARAHFRQRASSWLAAAFVLLYGILATALPVLALIYVSLSPFWQSQITFRDLTLRHYRAVLSDPLFVRAVWTSFEASVTAVLVVTALGFACATALLNSTCIWRPLRAAIDLLVMLPLAVPASLMGFGLLFAYTGPPLPLYGTPWVLIVTYVSLMIGYSTRLQFTEPVAEIWTGR